LLSDEIGCVSTSGGPPDGGELPRSSIPERAGHRPCDRPLQNSAMPADAAGFLRR